MIHRKIGEVLMDTAEDTPDETTESPSSGWAPIPIEQLVQEAYGSSVPDTQERILAQLVGTVYETAPAPLQVRLLEQLLRPVGVLSLIAIANGIFAKIHFRGAWPDAALHPADVQTVRSSDVVALVEHTMQTSGEALNGLARLLIGSPSLVGSGAATVLMALLLQRGQRRRATDQR
jgi:hypothetical protein